MKRILVDVDRCCGCRLCEMVCSFSHENSFGTSISRINVIKEDVFGFDLSIVCWHCHPCKAMEKCPEEAIERRSIKSIISLTRFFWHRQAANCRLLLLSCSSNYDPMFKLYIQ